MRDATRATAYRIVVRFAALTVFLWGCAPTTQGGIAPVRTPLETLRHSIDSLVSNPQFRGSHIGLLVVNPASGDTLYSRNAGKLFIPASNMKIITGASALALLGPDYRFETAFVGHGLIRDSVLEGHLVVAARGDPTVSDRVQQGNAMNWMARVADSLLAHGIKRVTGQLWRGPNVFPDTIYGYGWEWDDLSGGSAAPIDELLYNEGMTTVTRRIAGRDTTVATATTSPARTYLEALASALSSRGIVISGGISYTHEPLITDGFELFKITSPPLREILRYMEKPSQNQIAEVLLRTIGLERSGIGSADSGSAVVSRQLVAWGAERDGFIVYDGSGLSRHNLLTPETVVRTLVAIQRDTAFQVFYDALPIAGVDGTIRTRMVGTPAAGNMRAKTGSLEFARSLSGYVNNGDGDRLVFSILNNHFTVPVDSVSRFQNSVGVLLAGYRARRR
ncbi:MAG TPA: D-alanyl-D-alanine carboxypeptidase/D-alanyl-D-alanine-endopeptidase [Gemmatimonadaceae bacterium]|nr:D-alanyl-D-alanine carboxypeptidase/D-alanyl-D-alanine-endopeptidase [Gemmatimonadaceae bacterium]